MHFQTTNMASVILTILAASQLAASAHPVLFAGEAPTKHVARSVHAPHTELPPAGNPGGYKLPAVAGQGDYKPSTAAGQGGYKLPPLEERPSLIERLYRDAFGRVSKPIESFGKATTAPTTLEQEPNMENIATSSAGHIPRPHPYVD